MNETRPLSRQAVKLWAWMRSQHVLSNTVHNSHPSACLFHELAAAGIVELVANEAGDTLTAMLKQFLSVEELYGSEEEPGI
jgi:hypothetical protein